MNSDITMWNFGLLFAALIVILGVAGMITSEGLQYRWQASGLVLQGVILMFVAGGAYFPGSVDLRLGGITVTCLLIIQNLLVPIPESPSQPQEEN